jgi:hypothetical protein
MPKERLTIRPRHWLAEHSKRGHTVDVTIAGSGKQKVRRVECLTCDQRMSLRRKEKAA